MKLNKLLSTATAVTLATCSYGGAAYAPLSPPLSLSSSSQTAKSPTSRRELFGGIVTTAAAAIVLATEPQQAGAFDGSGSSAYAGQSAATKAELKKSYQKRIAADVRDFNSLGAALSTGDKSVKESSAWVFFFTNQVRRDADASGRTYAALADFRGLPTPDPNKFEGGDGYLLANTFTKSGKPPDNTPAVKSFNALSKAFDPIRVAGTKGDVAKAKIAWEKASKLFPNFLLDVEMSGDLADPTYK